MKLTKHNISNHCIFFYSTVFLSFIIYIICAYYKEGYYHPDEHFQIIEFANYKLGKVKPSDLPWEFNYEMRSTFQPWIAFIVIKFLDVFSINNPYLITFFLRVVTAIFAIIVISLFYLKTNILVGKYKIFYLFSLFLLWFLPFINTRFSSECWSGLFILLAIVLIKWNNSDSIKKSIFIGICIGLSYLCRFQSAAIIVGILAWLVFIQHNKFSRILLILTAFIWILIIGIFIDSLFYNHFVFTSWNYFNENILKGKSSYFGITSIPDFISLIVKSMYPPLGIVILIAYFFAFFSLKKDIILWSISPILIVHLIIPHKELRFFFPIANFLPYLIIVMFIKIKKNFTNKSGVIEKIWFNILISTLLIINVIALFISVLSPTENGRIKITNTIFKRYKNIDKVLFVYKTNANPYEPYPYLHQNFYYQDNIIFCDLLNYQPKMNLKYNTILIVIRRKDMNVDSIRKLVNNRFKIISEGNISFIRFFKKFYNKEDLLNDYILYKYNN